MEITEYRNRYQDLMQSAEVEIIDRSSGEITPFSDIEKHPSHTVTGNLTGFGVEIRDRTHENGWRPVATVSSRYLLVNNRDVVDIAERIIDGTGFGRLPRKIFFDGRRFVYSIVFPDVQEYVDDDDIITLGVQFRNSYDGSMKFRAEMYAERKVCTNGMTSRDRFAGHTFEHTIGNENWKDDLQRAMSVLNSGPERLEGFVHQLRQAAQTPLPYSALRALRSGGLQGLPVSRWGSIVDNFLNRQSETAYGLLNSTSQVLWHRDRSVQDLSYNTTCTDAILNFVTTQSQ